MKVTNKVKIKKVYLHTNNKDKPIITNSKTNNEQDSKMPISAELIKGTLVQFFGILSSVLFVLYIINFISIFDNDYSTLNKILMTIASVVLFVPFLIFIAQHTFLNKLELKNISNKSIGISMIIATVIGFIVFIKNKNFGIRIIFQLLFIYISMLLFSISKDLEKEENRDYILNYFSDSLHFQHLLSLLLHC